jgi:hypothetical protein
VVADPIAFKDVVDWVGEAVAALAVGWLVSHLNFRARLKDAVEASVKGLRDELEDLRLSLEADILRIDATLKELQSEDQKARIESSADHAGARALSDTVTELKKQSMETYAALNRVLGILEGRKQR